jgi:hypothetical protein
MNVNDLIDLAERLESLTRRSVTFGKDKADILEELDYIAKDLRGQADRIADDMATQAEQCDFA